MKDLVGFFYLKKGFHLSLSAINPLPSFVYLRQILCLKNRLFAGNGAIKPVIPVEYVIYDITVQ